MKHKSVSRIILQGAVMLMVSIVLMAGSRQGDGIIIAVDADDDGYVKEVTVQYEFASHFSGNPKTPFHFDRPVFPEFVFIVDGLPVPRELGQRALVPGRRVAITEDVACIQTYDHVSNVGRVKAVDSKQVTLVNLCNAEEGYDQGTSMRDIILALDENTLFLHDGIPADKHVVLAANNYVRVISARPQTVNVLDRYDPLFIYDGVYQGTRWGTLTSYEPSTRNFNLIALEPEGVVEIERHAVKHVALDSHFLPRHPGEWDRYHAAFEPNRQAFSFAHRNSTNPNEVYVQSRQEGEIRGKIVAVNDSRMSVSVWNGAAFETVEVSLSEDAEVNFNYRPIQEGEGPQVGHWVYVLPQQPMRILSGRWDRPQEPDTAAPPVPVVTATAPAYNAIHLEWESAIGLGYPAVAYEVYRDGERMATVYDGTFTDRSVVENATHSYTVRAVNRWGAHSAFSEARSVTTPLDDVPPELLWLDARSDLGAIVLKFNEPMDPVSVNQMSNYRLTGGVAIERVTLNEDGTQVTLHAPGLTAGTSYQLAVSMLADRTITKNQCVFEALYTRVAWPALEVSEVACLSGSTVQLGTLEVGAHVYTDRRDTYTAIPEPLAGLPALMTAQNDKKNSDPELIRFTVNRPITLWLFSALPAPQPGFEDSGLEVAHVGGGGHAYRMRITEPKTITLPGPIPADYSGRWTQMYTLAFDAKPHAKP